MDEELEDKIKDIGGMLGITNLPDNLGDIISSFLGSKDESASDSEYINSDDICQDDKLNIQNGTEHNDAPKSSGLNMLNLLSSFNSVQNGGEDDYKIQFLRSLKPLLGTHKKQKVDKCVKLFQFVKLAECYGHISR